MQLKREHLGFGLIILVGVGLLGATMISPYAPALPESGGVSPTPFTILGGLLVVAGVCRTGRYARRIPADIGRKIVT